MQKREEEPNCEGKIGFFSGREMKEFVSISPTFYEQLFSTISLRQNITNTNCKYRKASRKIVGEIVVTIAVVDARPPKNFAHL